MRILAIDTSSQVASAAILEDDKLVGEMTINHPRTHSQKLMPIIHSLCESLGLKVSDMDLIAVAGGPGSFTGVRIGLSAAKALAHPFNLPVVMISSLKGLAYNLPGYDGIVCPILDARRGEVYTAAYRWQSDSLLTMIEDQPMHLDELLERFKDGHAHKIIFLGDAAEKFKEQIQGVLGARAVIAPPSHGMQKASSIAMAALRNHKSAVKYDEVKANYLRRSEAEVTWEKKHGKQSD